MRQFWPGVAAQLVALGNVAAIRPTLSLTGMTCAEMLTAILLVVFCQVDDEALRALASDDVAVRAAAIDRLSAENTIPAEAVQPVLDMAAIELSGPKPKPRNAGDPVNIKFVGDEVPLPRIKADPNQFLDKQFWIAGAAEIDDYFNYGYMEAGDKFYSVNVRPVKQDGSYLSDGCHVYVNRSSGKALSDRLVKAAEDEKGLLVRFKVTLNRRRFEGADSWDLLEASEWQFYDWSINDWQRKPSDAAAALGACRVVLVKAGKSAVPGLVGSIASSESEAMRKFILGTIEQMDSDTVIAMRDQLLSTSRKLDKAAPGFERINEALFQVEKKVAEQAAAKEAETKADVEAKEKAAKSRIKQAESTLVLAKKFLGDGDQKHARDWLKKVVSKYPGTPAAQEASELLKKLQ